MTPKKIYLSKLVMAGAEILDKPVSDDDVEYIRVDVILTEIERLKGQLIRGACAAQIEMETNCKEEAYDEVLSFLSTSGKTISVKPGDEVTINGHKIVYDKDKDYVTIVKSAESVPNDIDFEQELYNRFGQIKDFTLGMRIGQYFYELGCHRTAKKYDEIEYNRQRAKEQNCEELEKEIYYYCPDSFEGFGFDNAVDLARHFAQWGAEHLKK